MAELKLRQDPDDQALFIGPVSQGAVNPNVSYQGIATLSASYNEVAVYGNYPTTSEVVAISHDSSGGYLYTDSDTLRISAGYYVRFTTAVVQVLASFGTVTPVENGDLVVEATTDQQLTFKFKGSDGVTRSGSITLT